MKKIVTVAAFIALIMLCTAAAGHDGCCQPQVPPNGHQAWEPSPPPGEEGRQEQWGLGPGEGQQEQWGRQQERDGLRQESQEQSLVEQQLRERPLAKGVQEVSKAQYDILYGQCRYADTADARARCQERVRNAYRIGARNPNLDCRTYSSVTVCGVLQLSERQKACVRESVKGGLTFRRAEVECYAFR
jgi:hypothetical protein